MNDVQVIDFGGITKLTAYLKTLPLFPGYEQVTAVVVVRTQKMTTCRCQQREGIFEASLVARSK